jgi:predicted DNA-binding protein
MDVKKKFSATSFRIPPVLKKRLKIAAAANDTDATAVVIAGIEDWLAKVENRSERPKIVPKSKQALR